jgi:hypothetical protein
MLNERIFFMIRHKLIYSAVILSSVSGLIYATTSLASAATVGSSNHRLSYVQVTEDKLSAEASVLGITQDQLTTDLKTMSLGQLIASKGLTKSQFKSQVKTQIENELASQGYSQPQINKWSNHSHHTSKHKNK